MVRISLKFRRQAGQIPPAAAAQGSAGTNPAPVAPNPASAPGLSSSAPAVSPALPGNPLPSVNHLAATPLPPNVAAPGVGGAAATPSTWNGAPSTASSVVPPPPPSNTAAQGMGGAAATSSSSGMTGPWTPTPPNLKWDLVLSLLLVPLELQHHPPLKLPRSRCQLLR